MATRLLPATSIGLTFFIEGLSGWSLYRQLDMAGAQGATLGVSMLVGLFLGVAAGALSYWLLLRRTKRPGQGHPK